jgi:hypothetical protein
MTVLAPAIARARRAHAWLLDAGVAALARIDLEPRVAALYLDEAPAGHKALIARLSRGESVRPLIDSPEIDRAVLTSALVELARRGAILALIDSEGRDALAPDSSRPASSGRGPRFRDAPAPVMPAAMTLAEAVLQAVSGPGEPNKPGARRTHPGLAPPAPPLPHVPRRGSGTPPLPDPSPVAQGDAASSEASPPDDANSSAAEAAEQSAAPDAALDEHESEPDTTDLDDDVAPPFSTAARVRAVMSPVLVTLAAAGLAFAGMRVIMGGGLERLGVAPSTLLPASTVDAADRSLPARLPAPPAAPPPLPLSSASTADASTDLDAPDTATPAPPEAAAPPADGTSQPAQLASTGEAASAALEPASPGVPPDVDVSTELLDPLPEPKLRAGHGMLEVSTWQPQRIYVDGVFVGNYERRLIPLAPGTYQLRLVAGDRDIQQPATIEAGRRTRVSLRLESK